MSAGSGHYFGRNKKTCAIVATRIIDLFWHCVSLLVCLGQFRQEVVSFQMRELWLLSCR